MNTDRDLYYDGLKTIILYHLHVTIFPISWLKLGQKKAHLIKITERFNQSHWKN